MQNEKVFAISIYYFAHHFTINYKDKYFVDIKVLLVRVLVTLYLILIGNLCYELQTFLNLCVERTDAEIKTIKAKCSEIDSLLWDGSVKLINEEMISKQNLYKIVRTIPLMPGCLH